VAEDALLAEMRALQDKVTGITGTAVASRDGLIVRQDTGGIDPDNLAALAATWLALTQRMSTEVRQGTLREAITRSSGGYVVIYAVGVRAVLVLLGDEGLDITRLHRESQETLERVGALLADGAPQSASPLPREAANAALTNRLYAAVPAVGGAFARYDQRAKTRATGPMPCPAPRRLHR
jgi:predicted regulator of Ras-like GTPase activity (Roadblock/LC7/MglB family)